MSGTPSQPNRQSSIRLTLIVLLGLLGLWVIHSFLPAVVWAVIIAVAVDPLVQRAPLFGGRGFHRGVRGGGPRADREGRRPGRARGA